MTPGIHFAAEPLNSLLPALSSNPPHPCSFVFEGKPPELKRHELSKRSTKKEEATTELEAAKEVGHGAVAWGRGMLR